MTLPRIDKVVKLLRQRLKAGDFTLEPRELRCVITLLDRADMRFAETYQMVGEVACYVRKLNQDSVINALDLLAWPHRKGEIVSLFHPPSNTKNQRKSTKPKKSARAKTAGARHQQTKRAK